MDGQNIRIGAVVRVAAEDFIRHAGKIGIVTSVSRYGRKRRHNFGLDYYLTFPGTQCILDTELLGTWHLDLIAHSTKAAQAVRDYDAGGSMDDYNATINAVAAKYATRA